MPSGSSRSRRSESRIRRLADEIYLGVLVVGSGAIVALLAVLALLYVIDFTSWVALND